MAGSTVRAGTATRASGAVRVGIDFGTANTVAVLALPDREPRPLLFDGSPLLPSAICADATGQLLVGRDALHTATTDPASFEPHPKRCIDDATVLLGNRDIPVPDLINAVLHRVASEATRTAGRPPTEAILTCPASWGDSRRNTLLTAAATALPAARLVAEPVAAAHHFISSVDEVPVGRTALVYDFGAGTFDASVLRRTVDGFDVLAARGLPDCGGLDIDAAIVTHLGTLLEQRDPVMWSRLVSPQSPGDRRASRQLWDNARAAKEMLSRTTQTHIHVPLFDTDEPLGREHLEQMAVPILGRTIEATRAVLRDARLTAASLAAVYLAGGSSRMPAVATLLHRTLSLAPTIVDQPELAVAEGSIHTPTSTPSPLSPAGTPPAALVPEVPAPVRPDRSRLILAGAAAALAATAAVLAVVLSNQPDGNAEADPPGRPAGGPGPAHSSPTPSATPSYPPGVDPCLVGTWRLASKQRDLTIDGQTVQFNGTTGDIDTFRPDGTMTVVFSNSSAKATVKGRHWEELVNGRGTARYKANNGTLILSNAQATGTWTLKVNGKRNNSGKLSLSLEPESYVCDSDTLSVATSFYALEYQRVVPATPSPAG